MNLNFMERDCLFSCPLVIRLRRDINKIFPRKEMEALSVVNATFTHSFYREISSYRKVTHFGKLYVVSHVRYDVSHHRNTHL